LAIFAKGVSTAHLLDCDSKPTSNKEHRVAKKTKKKLVRRGYTKAHEKELRIHSRAKTPLRAYKNVASLSVTIPSLCPLI
jgi:hypothetical protein